MDNLLSALQQNTEILGNLLAKRYQTNQTSSLCGRNTDENCEWCWPAVRNSCNLWHVIKRAREINYWCRVPWHRMKRPLWPASPWTFWWIAWNSMKLGNEYIHTFQNSRIQLYFAWYRIITYMFICASINTFVIEKFRCNIYISYLGYPGFRVYGEWHSSHLKWRPVKSKITW